MTVDPTLKAPLIDAAKEDVKVLQKLDRVKEFDVTSWVDDAPLRKPSLRADSITRRSATAPPTTKSRARTASASGRSPNRAKAGEIWVKDGDILPYASAACTLGAVNDLKTKGKDINVAYVFDTSRGIKLFAKEAFYVVGGGEIAPTC